MTKYIIIGPASYLLEKENNEFIDSFDVVVRIKSGYPVPKKLEKHLGSRTDILYTNLVEKRNNLTKENLNLIEENNIKLKYPFPILDDYTNLDLNDNIRIIYKNFIKNNKDIKVDTINLKTYKKVHSYLNKRPSILPLIITDILNENPKEIHLLGFTFRLNWLNKFDLFDGTYANYYRYNKDIISSYSGIKFNQVHDIQKEYDYINYLKMNNNIIKIDFDLYYKNIL